MKLIKTYVQISDLHFVGPIQRKVYDSWAQGVPLLEGFVGHAAGPLRYLRNTWGRLRSTERDPELIVTGDLTAYGARSQFDDADEYLSGAGTFPEYVGLRQTNWARLSIPGNHDFWPGISLVSLGWTNRTVRRRYPQDADIVLTSISADGRPIVFLRMNGDADVKPLSPERFYACGSFCSAVEKMDALLAQRDPREVRVLLLHHSYEYAGVSVTGSRWLPGAATLKHLTIDDASRDAVRELMQKHSIRIVLTGHVHRPYFVGRLGAAHGFTSEVLESCCGTTTQRQLDSDVETAQNSLVVHRIYEKDTGGVRWLSEVHTLQLMKTGFQRPVQPAPTNSTSWIDIH